MTQLTKDKNSDGIVSQSQTKLISVCYKGINVENNINMIYK